MKDGIPRNSCLAQWRRREVEGETLVSSSLTRFSSKVDVACKKMVY